MLTRRTFLRTTAVAGAVTLSRVSRLSAARYDVLIKGGRVIDPSRRLDRQMDVGISDGRIAAVTSRIDSSSAAQTIDASGRLVVPGLVDIHTHAARSRAMPPICLADGVTALIDAGSQGAETIDAAAEIARTAPNRMRILINIARTGILSDGELLDLSRADVAAAQQAIKRHRDVIVGVKARLSENVVGKNDLEALRRAVEVTRPFRLPVVIHIGDTASPLPAILALLRSGDIVTHAYSPPPRGILDGAGRLLPEVTAARRRGVRFDVANGRIRHITWEVAEGAIRQGFLPDTISTDWTDAGRTEQVFDFPNVLSKFLLLGMPLDQVIARATVNPARQFTAFKELGTLRVGAPADVAVLELREGKFEFVDNAGTIRTGRQKLFSAAVVVGGRPVRLQ